MPTQMHLMNSTLANTNASIQGLGEHSVVSNFVTSGGRKARSYNMKTESSTIKKRRSAHKSNFKQFKSFIIGRYFQASKNRPRSIRCPTSKQSTLPSQIVQQPPLVFTPLT